MKITSINCKVITLDNMATITSQAFLTNFLIGGFVIQCFTKDYEGSINRKLYFRE